MAMNYLKIKIETLDLGIGEEGCIVSLSRIYPIDHALDQSYRSFLTLETMELIDSVRTALKEHQR